MWIACFLSGIILSSSPGEDVVIFCTDQKAVHFSTDFQIRKSPHVVGGAYLGAVGQPGSPHPGKIRIAAPAGRYHVYLAWARHPKGANDVVVRLGGQTIRVNQKQLANGRSPDDLAHDDMAGYDGVCTSGLFRLTEKPVTFKPGETLEMVRSDSDKDSWTTLNYVVFSPYLYLDDLGNDAAWTGQPVLNLRDYGPAQSGPVGSGLVFLRPKQPDTLTWTMPAEGVFLLEINPNRGPNRAQKGQLEIGLPEGKRVTTTFEGQSPSFGRAGWQTAGLIKSRKGDRIRCQAVTEGFVCPDLLRLTSVDPATLVGPEKKRFEEFLVQWENPSPQRPWLREVRLAARPETGAIVEQPFRAEGLPHGARVKLPSSWITLWGSKEKRGLCRPAHGQFRVELADDYGFTLSAALLRGQPFVWLPDLGIFASASGDFAALASARQALEKQVAQAARQPFRSTSEQYLAWTGYDEARSSQDNRAFEFAYQVPRPPSLRRGSAIDAMPEVDYRYFCQRFPDLKHRRMFLGWPNVGQEFCVLSNGAIGVSSGSNLGTGHPPAEDFLVTFGLGQKPSFRPHGDTSVEQTIEDGYHLVVHTRWSEATTEAEAIALAYPMAGEEVRTGNEPLATHVRLIRRAGKEPFWLKITPDHYGAGQARPLASLETANLEEGLLKIGRRVILAVDRAQMSIESATKKFLLVKLLPQAEQADLVIPYVAVADRLVESARRLGFDKARQAMKRYWDARLARGARIEVADPVVVQQYKTLLPRTLLTADLDTQGDFALKTSPHVYEYVWLHATAYGIEGLARRGHFEEAKQYLEAGFRWQGSQASEASKGFTDWSGFFTAPPRYTALLWLNFHGWFQWAAARYFLFSDDRTWLEKKLPALIKSLEWTASQRRLSMRTNPDGSHPPQYGWLPPGRVTDGSAGTSTFTDCVNWMGVRELACVLERIRHRRAGEFRALAEDYRRCVLRGLRLAAREREPVRLNDGTFVPYVPGYLESVGHEESMWYAAVVDGGLEGILDSGIVPPGDPLENWVLANLEDNLFVMAPNLADEGHFLGHACGYLRRDEPRRAIYTFYSALATQAARATRTTFEHRSWGANRIYELAPWPMGYYTRLLAGMLCYDEGEELILCRATPQAWLAPGRTIGVQSMQTRFGPISYTLAATREGLRGTIDLPSRHRPAAIRLRLRVPGKPVSVLIDGRPALWDRSREEVILPVGKPRVEIEGRWAEFSGPP